MVSTPCKGWWEVDPYRFRYCSAIPRYHTPCSKSSPTNIHSGPVALYIGLFGGCNRHLCRRLQAGRVLHSWQGVYWEEVWGMQSISTILMDSLDNMPGQEWIVDVMEYAVDAGFTMRRAPSRDRFGNCIECRCPIPLYHYIFLYTNDVSHVLCFECVEAGYILDKQKQPPALLEKYRDKGEEAK